MFIIILLVDTIHKHNMMMVNDGLIDWRNFIRYTIEVGNAYRRPLTPPFIRGTRRRL